MSDNNAPKIGDKKTKPGRKTKVPKPLREQIDDMSYQALLGLLNDVKPDRIMVETEHGKKERKNFYTWTVGQNEHYCEAGDTPERAMRELTQNWYDEILRRCTTPILKQSKNGSKQIFTYFDSGTEKELGKLTVSTATKEEKGNTVLPYFW